MSKKNHNVEEFDDGSYVAKKKNHSVGVFLVCVLIAFLIWIYASALENKKASELSNGTETQQTSEELCIEENREIVI